MALHWCQGPHVIYNVSVSRDTTAKRHFVLAPVGSSGDVHPFVGLGCALQSRGHRVTVITNGYFAELIRSANLEFVEHISKEQYDEVTRDRNLWRPRRGFEAVMYWAMQGIEPLYEKIMMLQGGDASSSQCGHRHQCEQMTLVAGSLGLGARLAHEKHGMAYACVHLSPAIFLSSIEPPRLPGLFMPRWMPRWLREWQYWLGAKLVVNRVTLPHLNEIWQQHGLPPIRQRFMRWWHAPQCVVGLFPDWFAPKQSDWPTQTVLTGFPLYDEADVLPPDVADALRVYLSNSDQPPIVATAGSAQRHARDFFRQVILACEKINRRVVLLTRYPEQLPATLPAHVQHFDFVPLSAILPHAALMLHHGGVGTTAQTLAAGIPHLIQPLAHDQFDNASRVKKLGVGDTLPRRVRADQIARRMKNLLDDSDVVTRCVEIASRFENIDPLGRTCDILESLEPVGTSVSESCLGS